MIVSAPPLVQLTLPPGSPRAAGLHISDIYNDYYALLEPERYGKKRKPIGGGTKDPKDLYMMLGNIFEQTLERALVDTLGPLLGGERPGEFLTKDGDGGSLAFNPDLILFPGKHPRGAEIKLAWATCRECPISPAMAKAYGLTQTWDGKDPDVVFPSKFDKYFTQMKLYGYHLKIHDWRLFICFVNGDYRPPRPVLLSWDFTFNDRELVEEWTKMDNHRRRRKLTGESHESDRRTVSPAPRSRRGSYRRRA